MPARTLTASAAVRWLDSLSKIETALAMAEDIGGITHPQWVTVWRAKADAAAIRRELHSLTCADVAVETQAAANDDAPLAVAAERL